MSPSHRAPIGATITPDYAPYLSTSKDIPLAVDNPLLGCLLVLSDRGSIDISGTLVEDIWNPRHEVLPTLNGWGATIGMSWDRWRFPRGVPWTDLPMPMPPRTVLHAWMRAEAFPVRDCRNISSTHILHALEAPRAILAIKPSHPDLPGHQFRQVEDMHVAAYADLIEAQGLQDIEMYLHDGEPRAVTLGGLREVAAPSEPWRRFLYSWAFNFTAIGAKALTYALASATEEEGSASQLVLRGPEGAPAPSNVATLAIKSARKKVAWTATRIGPLELQVLYLIRSLGSVDVSHCLGPYGQQSRGLLSTVLDVPGIGFAWTGTGKYPPFLVETFRMVTMGNLFLESLLIEVRDRRMCLSATGQRFLDALHPDCDDADLPCRWTHRALTTADSKSLDASLIRTFRKLKTRVNLLQ